MWGRKREQRAHDEEHDAGHNRHVVAGHVLDGASVCTLAMNIGSSQMAASRCSIWEAYGKHLLQRVEHPNRHDESGLELPLKMIGRQVGHAWIHTTNICG